MCHRNRHALVHSPNVIYALSNRGLDVWLEVELVGVVDGVTRANPGFCDRGKRCVGDLVDELLFLRKEFAGFSDLFGPSNHPSSTLPKTRHFALAGR